MFQLNEIEQQRATDFRKAHRTDPENLGCCDGQFSYIFTPTSIGVCVSIKDNVSGDVKNITDFGDW